MKSDSAIEVRDASYTLPVIPLPGKVIFPGLNTPLNVVRETGVLAVKYALDTDRVVLLLNQKNKDTESPSMEDFHAVGTIADVVDSYDPGDDSIRIAVEGSSRGEVLKLVEDNGFFSAEVCVPAEDSSSSDDASSLMRKAIKLLERYVRISKQSSSEALVIVRKEVDPGKLADYIASLIIGSQSERLQQVLDTIDPIERIRLVNQFLDEELDILELDRKIDSKVRKSIEKTHKEFYLQEKMKEIQKELGRGDNPSEIEDLREQIEKADMSEEAKEKSEKELNRLQQMPPMSAEFGVIRTYLDWILSLPWDKRTTSKFDIQQAEEILNEDHYGLEKPKERILEYLAVMKLVDKVKGPILCFVGPPGVGKTSLGKSVARSTDRNFIRMSLGGVRDESEIRGHRRTYIGSMPGRIIQGICDAKSKNPLFLLDEVDKMGSDFRGDPASALLEVLDPEQNDTFRDHYLDTAFDLSEVMFITTANTKMSIPPPLLDRMEIIELAGYTEYEKSRIANQFLIPKQVESHGLRKDSVSFSDTSISEIINKYTREAGVRNLEREVTTVCRRVAKKIAVGNDKSEQFPVDLDNLTDYLGPEKFTRRKAEEHDEIGVATGMVYTQVGGDIIAIEATTMRGKGDLTLTGQLGDVMKESAQTALAYIQSRSKSLNLPDDYNFSDNSIHIHVPEGAVPKEGPSAGITIATAMISALTGKEVRSDIAMTGEITLRGRVLPIGGLKEKVLAAHRNNIGNVIIPEENDKDLSEIPEEIRGGLRFHKVDHMTQVLDLAFRKSNASGQVSSN
ncbi:TPA: endopeptidase La [Candidatus Poribacteria bacterium]|nr:endopeptidase La [Candidatus Poribacteria bacterium]